MHYCDRFKVLPGKKVHLGEIESRQNGGLTKEMALPSLEENRQRLDAFQQLLYAEHRRSLLVIFQAMDCGGKDGTIRHVMGQLNPQGCRVTSFKAPSLEELDHDFLWRIHRVVPPKGMIGVFNRSHYEDVLIARVRDLVPKAVWSKRFGQINAFESALAAAGVHIVKLFLHISSEEQLERLRARLEDPQKHWKIDPADFEERRYWDAYHRAYEDVLRRCSTDDAPWYVVPADRKWFRNLVVSEILVETMESFGMEYPAPVADIGQLRRRYGEDA